MDWLVIQFLLRGSVFDSRFVVTTLFNFSVQHKIFRIFSLKAVVYLISTLFRRQFPMMGKLYTAEWLYFDVDYQLMGKLYTADRRYFDVDYQLMGIEYRWSTQFRRQNQVKDQNRGVEIASISSQFQSISRRQTPEIFRRKIDIDFESTIGRNYESIWRHIDVELRSTWFNGNEVLVDM